MTLATKAWLSTNDVWRLLVAAAVTTERGTLWTEREALVWMQAAGQRRHGLTVVSRAVFDAAFPEVAGVLRAELEDSGEE